MNLKTPEMVRQGPEECDIGESVAAAAVPHWDGRIRLTEFYPAALAAGEKPWIFAASYKELDPVGWKRVE
ncbi:hypothetical protein OJ996_26010 [Luteolibacter sp. GHJ8]|uniref:Uncharacterized protein n=1 Tax=Luteolibacter rhizosphaerae TaxID=2989719 RepID=A0ABT3GC34_9BACT|nr:hypothetical protein [Luteolibacter rhizosphaerae]MCW1917071.1 hypothetical protein [Luteolibacter rhizosphaerae]